MEKKIPFSLFKFKKFEFYPFMARNLIMAAAKSVIKQE